MQEAQVNQKKAETLAVDVQKEVAEKLAEMTHQLDKAIQEKIQYKILADEKRDKVEILNDENKSLRVKIQDLDDDIKRYRK